MLYTAPCGDDEFMCDVDGRCIDARLVCDGTKQCADGQDEQNCNGMYM